MTTVTQLNEMTPRIKVIGVGGAGGNAVAHMIARGVQGVDFIAANTDAQALSRTKAPLLIALGENGLGAGANPSVGRESALSERKRITQAIEGANMVFITAGMGGGTGTGAAPVVAEIAREMGILTVGVVTKPFDFEGSKRMRSAQQGIDELHKHVDSLIVVLNEKLLDVLGDDITQAEAFKAADDVLFNATAGVADIINKPGMVNVDFQDVRTVMGERGRAMMGSGVASGPERAKQAAEMAIACPLLEGIELRGARGVLVNICASTASLKMRETKEIMNIIKQYADQEATIIYGAVHDDSMGDELRVTLIATGLDGEGESARAMNEARIQLDQAPTGLLQQASVWRSGRGEETATASVEIATADTTAAQTATASEQTSSTPAVAKAAKLPAPAAGDRFAIPAFLRKYSGTR